MTLCTLWGLISQHKIIITVTEVNLSSFCQTNSITSRWLDTLRKSSNKSSTFGQDIVMMRWVHPVSICDAFIRTLKREYWLTKPLYIKIFTWPVLLPEQNQFEAPFAFDVCNFRVPVLSTLAALPSANLFKVKSVASHSFLVQTSVARLEAFLGFVPVS